MEAKDEGTASVLKRPGQEVDAHSWSSAHRQNVRFAREHQFLVAKDKSKLGHTNWTLET